jgi:putative phosphoesterase
MVKKAAVKIGIIADTHNHWDGKIVDIFSGVDHILHAGDIGLPWILLELEYIAPVTAVLGNNDEGLTFKETELVQLGSRRFLLHHIVDPKKPDEKLKRKLIRENPDVVVFGHSHKRFCENIGNTLFLNPGYAGPKRFNLPRSVAILHCDDEGITADFHQLD